MQFLNPAVLVGLVAAALPLAIHLLHRGHSRPHPFSDLAFLRQLHQNRMRRIQMRQWLILALRTLIIALIVCAFARPTYQSGAGWGEGAHPVAAHVLVDLSYSTRYRLASGPLFSQLQAQVLDLLNVFAPRDRVTIQPFAKRPQLPVQGDLEYLAGRTAELTPNQEATDLRTALHSAAQHLSQEPELDHELFLCTDLSRHNWDQLENMGPSLAGIRIYIATPEIPTRPNAYVKKAETDSWMLSATNKATLQIEIAQSGTTPLKDATLDLFVAGERLRRQRIDLSAEGSVLAEFSFSPRGTGRLSGHVVLEDDALALDNRRYFTIDLPTAITTLLLGDHPDDTYYPRRALGAAAHFDPTLEIRSSLLADLNADTIADVDVIALCNLKRLGTAQKALLGKFVANGGGLVIFPNPRIDLKYYNREFLPGLTPIRFKNLIGSPDNTETYRFLDPKAPHHPLFKRLFSDQKPDQPRFYTTFAMTAAPEILPLARFTDGQIAMALTWTDRGRVALSGFPLDPESNDLHLRGLFAPLLHRLVRELSLAPNRRATYQVGDTVYRRLNNLGIEALVDAETPSGERLRLEPERVGGQYLWKIPQVSEAGIWHLYSEGDHIDLFAVNLDTNESDLTPVDPERIRRILAPADLHFLTPGEDLRLAVLGNRYGRELWRECLILSLCLLVLELWIARAPRDTKKLQTT